MASNEDYLNDLLKSITKDGKNAVNQENEEVSPEIMDNQESKEDSSENRDTKYKEAEPDELDMSDMDALLNAVKKDDADYSSPDLEDAMQMSEEEISRLLEGNQELSSINSESAEATDLLDLDNDNNDILEIYDLLNKADQNEAIEEAAKLTPKEEKTLKAAARKVEKEAKKAARKAERLKRQKSKSNGITEPVDDMEEDAAVSNQETDLIMDVPLDTSMETIDILDDAIQTAAAIPVEFADQNDREEATQESIPEEDAGMEKTKETDKKKNVFSKIIDFIMQDDDLEEDDKQSIKLSKENESILDELDHEKIAKKKGKGKGKPDKKKGKGAPKEKGKKEKKVKTEKKKKKEKADPEPPLKKLSRKGIIIIVLLCTTLGAAILILSDIAGDYIDKENAKQAYLDGRYQECYEILYGMKLNEDEDEMFFMAEALLRIDQKVIGYHNFMDADLRVEALDYLIQFVYDFQEMYANAEMYGFGSEIQNAYQNIIIILQNEYEITEEQALEIAREENDVKYTRTVTNLANGIRMGQITAAEAADDRQDVLPEESELTDSTFVD